MTFPKWCKTNAGPIFVGDKTRLGIVTDILPRPFGQTFTVIQITDSDGNVIEREMPLP